MKNTKTVLIINGAWKCMQCNHINKPNKYALETIEKGNILVSSCHGCNYRFQLMN